MGNRLTKIYTRTGDDGSTGLGDGSRIAKDALRVETFGSVDETNAHIGVVLSLPAPDSVRHCLLVTQHRLFDLGGELCIPAHNVINDRHVAELEDWIDSLNRDLPPLKEFILPGGSPAAAHCHVARTVCRRSERLLVALQRQDTINACSLRYLNRLSDLLFVAARVIARAEGGNEVYWQKDL